MEGEGNQDNEERLERDEGISHEQSVVVSNNVVDLSNLEKQSFEQVNQNDSIAYAHENLRAIYYVLAICAIVDVMCFPKFIILAYIVVELVKGPALVLIPFSLWGLIYYFVIFMLLFYFMIPKDQTLMSYCRNGVISWYRKAKGLILDRELVVSKDSSIDPKDEIMYLSTFRILCIVIFSSFDIAITIAVCVLTFVLMNMLFVDVDKTMVTGWKYLYNASIAEIVFCLISVICKLMWIILFVVLYCIRFECCRKCINTMPTKNSSITIDESGSIIEYSMRKASIPSFILKSLRSSYLIFFVVALVFTSIALNDQLKSQFYENTSHAEYSNCDPIVSRACALPFPSFEWLTADPTTETGWKVDMTDKLLPFTRRGDHASANFMNSYDGFSVSSPLLWHLDGMREDQFINFQYIARSVLPNSTSLILDLNHNRFEPHFTEMDYLYDGPDKIAYVQPASSLRYNTHYAVIIKDLTTSNNQMLEPSSLFKIYRESYLMNRTIDDERFLRFKNVIFPKLQTLNINLSNIQLVWDFQTASQGSLLQSLSNIYNSTLHQVSRVLRLSKQDILSEMNHFSFPIIENISDNNNNSLRFPDNGVTPLMSVYRKILTQTNSQCANYHSGDNSMARVVYFRINVPWFLDNLNFVENHLSKFYEASYDEFDNIPITGDVGMLIQIPCSVYTGQVKPSMLMEYGHGILDTREVATYEYLQSMASQQGWILWSMDWRGFTIYDAPNLLRMCMYRSDSIDTIEAAVIQGFSSKLAGRFIVRHILASERTFLGLDNSLDLSSRSLPGRFIGQSMGGILGSAYTAFAGYEQGAFLVSGSPFTFMVTRSKLFSTFLVTMFFQYYNAIDMRIIMTSYQLLFDAFESSGWKYSGVYNKMTTLTEIAEGDVVVSTVAGRIFSMNLNASLMTPSIFPVYGLPSVVTPAVEIIDGRHFLNSGSYPGDASEIPLSNQIPSKKTSVHYCLDTEPFVQNQLLEFFNKSIETSCPIGGCIYGEHASC